MTKLSTLYNYTATINVLFVAFVVCEKTSCDDNLFRVRLISIFIVSEKSNVFNYCLVCGTAIFCVLR